MPKIYAFADEASSMIDLQIAALRRNHLMLFDGLSNLERSGEDRKIGSFAYQSQDEAFDAAAAAFRTILQSI